MLEQDILKIFDGFEVAIMPTKHFMDEQSQDHFAFNVIGKATIMAQSLAVGSELEVTVFSNGKATAVIKRVSERVAILKTGWAGARKLSKAKHGCASINI